MKWFGLIAFVLIICYMSKISELERKVKKCMIKKNGGDTMLKLIPEIVGEKCKLSLIDDYLEPEVVCEILDADDEWIKIEFTNKKGIVKTKIMRIDSINSIELVED